MSHPTQRDSQSRKPAAWKGEVDFRALADSLPGLVFVCDASGACIFTNTRYQEFTGLRRDEWLGAGWAEAIHPDDRLATVEGWIAAVAVAEPYEVEYRLRAADGDHAWFLVRATPVREHGRVVRWVGHATDIEDAKRAGAARAAALSATVDQCRTDQRAAEAFAARLVEATTDSIKTLSPDGRVLSLNSAGLASTDATCVEDVLGRPWVERWRGTGYHVAAQQAIEVARAGGVGRFVGRHRRPDGGLAWWNVIITPIRDAMGRTERLLCVARDVTDVKEAAERARLIAETVREVFYQVEIGSGRISYVSPAYEVVWGRSAAELVADPLAWMEAIHPEDRPKVQEAMSRQRRGEATRREYRILRPDGELRYVRDLCHPVFDAEGRTAQVVGAIEDITEITEMRARAAAADEARYRGVFEHATVGIARVALDGRFLEVNGHFCEMLDYSREELLAGGFQEITHPEDLDADLANVATLLDGRAESYSMEKRYITRTGRVLRANLTGGIVRAPGGTADHFVAVVRPLPDGGAVDEAEFRALQDSERAAAFRLDLADALRTLDDPASMMDAATERLGRHLGVAQVGFAEVDESGQHIAVHCVWGDGRVPSVRGTWRMDDFGPQFIADMKAGATIVIPDVAADFRTNAAQVLEAYRGIGTRAILNRGLLRDGRMTALLFIHHHEPRDWSPSDVALAEEVAERLWSAVERVRTERQLVESEALARDRLAELDQLYLHAPVGLCTVDRDYRLTRINAHMAEINGVPVEESLGRTMWEVVPDLAHHLVEVYRPVLERGEPVLDVSLHGETPALPGVPRDWLANYFPLLSGSGEVMGLIGVVVEVTDRKRADERLAESEARFRAITDAMPQIVWSTLPDGFHDFYNARWYEFTGVAEGSTDGEGWNEIFHPEDQARSLARWSQSLGSGEPYEIEYRLRHNSGEYRWVLGRALPIRNDAGEIIRWMGTCTDIHEIVETRQALAESRLDVERAKAELETRVAERTAALEEVARTLREEMARREEAQSHLLQAQKMEALGQLVGGVAHDFNNILAAVQGAFAVLDRRVDNPKLKPIIEQGQKAGDRAAALVRQMLAFARREDVAPKVVETGELVASLEGMICHTVGARVACQFDIAPNAWPVLVDPHQLEVTLLNLAINARDAMEGEGTLRVGVRNLRPGEWRPGLLGPGDHVVLTVADTGVGMDAPTIARVFEPFFTTKPVGQGTGLGLAQVHGFVQGAGGAIHVESTPGQGTTMSLFLPRSAIAASAEAVAPIVSPALHGRATLLVVDDDEQVRPVTAAYLRDLGYSVIEAASAGAALALSRIHGIDLLLSDVVMPGSDGPTLARQLRAERPFLPVVFMTGFTGEHRLEGEAVLTKPFTGPTLELHILRVLGRIDSRAAERLGTPPREPERLLLRMKAPNLRLAHERWSGARSGRRLPDLTNFDAAGLDTGAMILLRPESEGARLDFRVLTVGEDLSQRLGEPWEGRLITPEAEVALGSMEEAYQRCLATLAPTYEWARLRLGDRVVRFERLLLPFSVDGANISQLLGLIQFDESDAPMPDHRG